MSEDIENADITFDQSGNAAAIINAVRHMQRDAKIETLRPTQIPGAEIPIAIVPDGWTVQSMHSVVDTFRDSRPRPKGFCYFHDLESFCEYVNQHASIDTTRIFLDASDRTKPKMTAIFNHHRTRSDSDLSAEQHQAYAPADWGAQYHFPLSDEWLAWNRATNVMEPKAFAEFLEDRLPDVLDPQAAPASTRALADSVGIQLAAPARLLELSRGVEIAMDTRVKNSLNLATGETTVIFEETQRSDAPLRIPHGFVIGIPVLRRGDVYPIIVRLRHRVRDQKLVYQLSLFGVDKVLQTVIADAQTHVESKTEIDVYLGTP